MRAVTIHAAGDIRVNNVADAQLEKPTDAVVKVAAACVCGSDLWPYRSDEEVDPGARMGHEYVGQVTEIGAEVQDIQVGDWVVGFFVASCGKCEICQAGYPSGCVNREFMGGVGTQAEYARIPLADGTLVKLPAEPNDDQLRHVLAASDVLGTGWFGADVAGAGEGKIIGVVGDGAVGLSAVLAAKQMGAERIVVSSRHETRQELAKKFGATDIIPERGEEFVEKVKELTDGVGLHGCVEAVGTDGSMKQAIGATCRGGNVGFVGVSHGVELDGQELFFSQVSLEGGPAPVRKYLPELVELIYAGKITPGDVFDKTLSLEDAAAGYAAMDRREAIKVMLKP
ncbi:IMP dehydrogenase [Corynebacterium propinquum]|uniref:zinc-binding dehydrogenase n=1 Tax=Corynebacterium propinquum TaxID=43769 RepID=UPI000F87A1D4|nr:alcohol dehydrogenase catalytic domain-containing protein [Corynebacterium propinquum]RUP75863.1 IMP dehydrogenase [Corynebacterium propinquum]RUP86937.1 IMP dehydrogenase [Corynebacterium propinquum]RUP92352.1 IMP dehydrogenase [Corynebacterium propinquum]